MDALALLSWARALQVGSLRSRWDFAPGFRPDAVHLQVSCPRANAHGRNRLAVTPVTRSWSFEVTRPTPPSGAGTKVVASFAFYTRVLIAC